jgi:hypothetical protein
MSWPCFSSGRTSAHHISTTAPTLSTSKRLMAELRDNSPVSSSVTTAVPVFLEPEAEGLYREVLAALNEHRVPYAVAGAVALEKYTGIWRTTKDLDLFMESQHIRQALEHLQRRGFRCETPDPIWLAKAHRGEYFVDLISGMSNGVIMVDDSWMKRTQPAIVVGVETRIISPEDLIGSKLFVTRRERFDGADIAHIIYRTRGSLQWDRLLELVGEHWEMLLWALLLFRYIYPAHSDYVPSTLWQDLLSRYTQLVQHKDPSAPFRGSLVDENMFSVDMKDWGLEDLQSEFRARRMGNQAARTPETPRSKGNGRSL